MIKWPLALVGALAGSPIHALEPGAPVLVSRTSNGAPAVGVCSVPRFDQSSARFLTFTCADALVPNDGNMRVDTHLLDRLTGAIERVSVTSGGTEVQFDSGGGVPSTDGSLVAFGSRGPLHPDATVPPFVNISNVFLRDRLLGSTEFVSRNIDGQLSAFSVVFEDAIPGLNEVLVHTRSQLLDPDGQLSLEQINLYLINWQSSQIELISRTDGGGLANGTSASARISTNGRFVSFASDSTTLPNAPESGLNLYLRDRATGGTSRLTRPWHGGEFALPMTLDAQPRPSVDGSIVLFSSTSPELIATDPPGAPLPQQVYLLHRASASYERISVGPSGEAADAYSGAADMSDDGRFVAFFSRATNLPATGSSIYVVDRSTGQWVNVTSPLGPLVGVGTAPRLDLARDGSAIAFSWRSADPASPYFDRSLIFTVELRGTVPPAAPARPVPGGPGGAWLAMAVLALVAAAWRYRWAR